MSPLTCHRISILHIITKTKERYNGINLKQKLIVSVYNVKYWIKKKKWISYSLFSYIDHKLLIFIKLITLQYSKKVFELERKMWAILYTLYVILLISPLCNFWNLEPLYSEIGILNWTIMTIVMPLVFICSILVIKIKYFFCLKMGIINLVQIMSDSFSLLTFDIFTNFYLLGHFI